MGSLALDCLGASVAAGRKAPVSLYRNRSRRAGSPIATEAFQLGSGLHRRRDQTTRPTDGSAEGARASCDQGRIPEIDGRRSRYLRAQPLGQDRSAERQWLKPHSSWLRRSLWTSFRLLTVVVDEAKYIERQPEERICKYTKHCCNDPRFAVAVRRGIAQAIGHC